MKLKQKKDASCTSSQADRASIRHNTDKDAPALEDMQEDGNVPLPTSVFDDAVQKCSKRARCSPEVIGDGDDVPVPLSSDNQVNCDAKKHAKRMKVIRSNRRVSPATDAPIVDQTQGSRCLDVQLNINNGNGCEDQVEQSHHLDNEVSVAKVGLAIASPVEAYLAGDKPIYEAYELDPSLKTSFYKSLRYCIFTTIALIIAASTISLSVIFGQRKMNGGDQMMRFNKTSYLESLGIQKSVKIKEDP
jgi:hypothetical protein